MNPIPSYDQLTQYLKQLQRDVIQLADVNSNGHDLKGAKECGKILIDVNTAIDDLAEIKTKVKNAFASYPQSQLTFRTTSFTKDMTVIQMSVIGSVLNEKLNFPSLTALKTRIDRELSRQSFSQENIQPTIDKLAELSISISPFNDTAPKSFLESLNKPLIPSPSIPLLIPKAAVQTPPAKYRGLTRDLCRLDVIVYESMTKRRGKVTSMEYRHPNEALVSIQWLDNRGVFFLTLTKEPSKLYQIKD